MGKGFVVHFDIRALKGRCLYVLIGVVERTCKKRKFKM